MKRSGIFALLLLMTAPALAGADNPAAAAPPLVIDVRSADEYQQSHVRQAVNVPYDQIASRIAALAPAHDTPIALYCHSGRRAGIAEQTLHQLGYSHVENKGGLSDMQRNGYPTE
ncbi:MAG TPA: rhodanese-like domain-containing protein [Candidatus Competibacteraceae bacterium]|nr:MAG: rhodanese-like domain-containing protein [Candidatus Competibacteraceae bacterium]HOB62825.1 rhodanese-like domain-containing protein [Candidatus Competibacteraceae bacterium]HQA27398.1 rhodanese-like domain-containing protein [Candidatus Competibacteraceae bacterium]HQD57212.1 rhodanese-like domain-containing protein [Candidatus Competibacteraceae bacterium]